MKKTISKIYYALIGFTLPYLYFFFRLRYLYFEKKYQIKSTIVWVRKPRSLYLKIDKNAKHKSDKNVNYGGFGYKKLDTLHLQNKNKNSKYFQLWSIKKQLKIFKTRNYNFIDIGSGWGLPLIYFNHYLKFKKLTGIENQDEFVHSSRKTIKKNNLKNIKIKKSNAIEFQWKGNSTIFINIPHYDILNKIFNKNAENIAKNKNIIVVINSNTFKFFKKKRLFKGYKFIKNSLMRYYIIYN